MKYKYYPSVIKFIRKGIKNKFPEIKPKRDQRNIPRHLWWMMDEMQKFDSPAKRGRWIGWIMAHAEILGIMTNEQSRQLAKKDSHSGFI